MTLRTIPVAVCVVADIGRPALVRGEAEEVPRAKVNGVVRQVVASLALQAHNLGQSIGAEHDQGVLGAGGRGRGCHSWVGTRALKVK